MHFLEPLIPGVVGVICLMCPGVLIRKDHPERARRIRTYRIMGLGLLAVAVMYAVINANR